MLMPLAERDRRSTGMRIIKHVPARALLALGLLSLSATSLAAQVGVPADTLAEVGAADVLVADTLRAPGPLTPEDFDQWESLGWADLAPDGAWLAAQVTRVDGDGELRIHQVDSDSVVVIRHGSGSTFSNDGRWVSFFVGVSQDEREAAGKADMPIDPRLGLLDLVRW